MGTLSISAILLQRGRLLLNNQQFRRAKRTLQQVVSFADAPTHGEALTLLAEHEERMGRYRRACTHWQAAVRMQPTNAELLYRWAKALEQAGKPRRAWRVIRQALKSQPQEPRFWVTYGQVALHRQREQTARRAFARASQAEGLPVAVLAELVEGWQALGEHDEARRCLVLARFRTPNDPAWQQLWNDFLFRQQAGPLPEPTLLPFPTTAGHIVRHDGASTPQPHILRLPNTRPQRR